MNRTARRSLVVVGLAVAFYGRSTLTGGSLGTPPWWERRIPESEWGAEFERMQRPGAIHDTREEYDGPMFEFPTAIFRAREGREIVSWSVVAVGLCLAAFGAWPRRRQSQGAL